MAFSNFQNIIQAKQVVFDKRSDKSSKLFNRYDLTQMNVLFYLHGPLLFIIFVNSLPESVNTNCKCVMYADDTTLLLSSSDPNILQKDLDLNLNKIASWFQTNNLTLNIKKTKLMLFGTKQSLCKFKDTSLIYEGVMIERVEKFKYLGVLFDGSTIVLG